MRIFLEPDQQKKDIDNPGMLKGIRKNSVEKLGNIKKSCVYQAGKQNPSVDNCAYEEHGKSLQNLKDLFGGKPDVDSERKKMTILSNCMSKEDYKKAMEEGFTPAEMSGEKLVTIVDHIKTEMAKAGVVVAGYNDSLDEETIQEIVGDSGEAREILKALQKNDLPCKEENIKEIKKTLDCAKEITSLEDASKKYLIENKMDLTMDALYKASFSAYGNGNKQSNGYFSQECNGYFAEKATDIDWKMMTEQLEQSISKMQGLQGTKTEQIKEAKWLLEKGIPVDEEAMKRLEELNKLSFPFPTEQIIEAAVASIRDGFSAGEGSLTNIRENQYQSAVAVLDTVQSLSEHAVAVCVKEERKLHISNLTKAEEEFKNMSDQEKNDIFSWSAKKQGIFVTARRQLFEIQLTMTVKANLQLMKSNLQIETTELSKLVDLLKEQEAETEQQLIGIEQKKFQKSAYTNPGQALHLYYETNRVVKEIPFLPVDTIGKLAEQKETVSLADVSTVGKQLKIKWDTALESYEEMMTKPRKDYGDRIKVAFRNSDIRLQELGLPFSNDNRKSLRILSYNHMELNIENLNRVKNLVLQLEDVEKSLTPEKVLQLIREGENPLQMSMDELEKKLHGMETLEEENKKFARFLYELDEKNEITEEERKSFIGIYRYFRQLEKTDAAAIGGLVATGAEYTLGNLLTAMRTNKRENRSYLVDENFGGTIAKETGQDSISTQIEAGMQKSSLSHAIYRDLKVEGLMRLPNIETASLTDVREELQKEEDSTVLESEIMEQQEKMEAAIKAEDNVFTFLRKWELPITAEQILATEQLFSKENHLFVKYKKLSESLKEGETVLNQEGEEFIQAFTNQSSLTEVLESMEDKMEDHLFTMSEEKVENLIDLREIQACTKQLSLITALQKKESYHIPVIMGEEMTLFHVSFVKDTEEKGTVKIAMDCENYGTVTAKYQCQQENVSGYIVYERKDAKERLEDIAKAITKDLEEIGLFVKEQRFVEAAKNPDLLTFFSGDVDNNKEQITNQRLYQIAKIFVEEIRKNS